MSSTHIFSNIRNSFIAATLVTVLGIMSFFIFEPQVSRAIVDEFVVTQEITDEISWNVQSQDVTMTGSIAGLTGGYATGTVIVSVNTNSSSGYNMTIAFFDNAAAHAMVASSTDVASDYISDYTPAVAGVPDFDWIDNAGGGSAEFGYNVMASTSSEVDPSFMNNTSSCDAGTNETLNKCWLDPDTVAETIINSPAANGSSTTTIKFKVAVPNAPSPAIPSGFYAATGTLTALVNP